MYKEPVALKGRNNLNATATSSTSQPGPFHGRTSERNVCCGDGFFRSTDPTGNGASFQNRDSEMTASGFDDAFKSSIHSIKHKRSPCRGISKLSTSGREASKENAKLAKPTEIEELQRKLSVAEGQLHASISARKLLEQEKKQLYESYQHMAKVFEQARINNQMLTRELNFHRAEGQMLKNRLTDRTAKLEECLQILNGKYNHFEKISEKAEACQQNDTFRNKTLEADIVHLKEQLVDLYQQNYDLKSELETVKNSTSANSKITATIQTHSKCEAERDLLIQWKWNLEEYYQSEIAKLTSKAKQQRDAPCFKCNQLCRIVIALNDQLNEYRKEDSLNVERVATQAFGETAQKMAQRLSQEVSTTLLR